MLFVYDLTKSEEWDQIVRTFEKYDVYYLSGYTKAFQKNGDGRYEAKSSLKNEVLFRQFNLMNPLPFRKPLHVVFIRNVMIYFEEETKRRLLERIVNAMVPGGYLFVGTTESVDRDALGLDYVIPSVYRKK